MKVLNIFPHFFTFTQLRFIQIGVYNSFDLLASNWAFLAKIVHATINQFVENYNIHQTNP